jgi:hypothetical protein
VLALEREVLRTFSIDIVEDAFNDPSIPRAV